MNTQDERDANLIVVATVQGFALEHEMEPSAVLQLFDKHGIIELVRSQYDVLHTQDIFEGAAFANDVLTRAGV